jgi:hypothetical protein
VAIAAATQMQDFPTTPEYARQMGKRFYRSSEAILFCLSQDEADNYWNLINIDVQNLVTNIDAAANALTTTQVVLVSADEISAPQPATTALVTLSWQPEGVAANGGGQQGINSSSATFANTYYPFLAVNYPEAPTPPEPANWLYAQGWLPVSLRPASFQEPTPVGALFWLNWASNPNLVQYWPLGAPLPNHQLILNGVILPYGVAYVITNDALYWLDFNPDSIANYPKTGNAPWPTDYVNVSSPGTDIPSLQLSIFL